MIERVHIVEDWASMGHQLVILGRQHPGAPTSWLTAAGDWEPLQEGAQFGDQRIGFWLPDGALDAIVAAYSKVAAPHPARVTGLLARALIRAAYAIDRPTATYAIVLQELRGRRPNAG